MPRRGYCIHLRQTFSLKLGVPNRQDLINHQDLRLKMCGHCKGEADVHAAGIVLDRSVKKSLYPRKIHNLIEFKIYFGSLHAQNGAA
jgi:hypothetical protein